MEHHCAALSVCLSVIAKVLASQAMKEKNSVLYVVAVSRSNTLLHLTHAKEGTFTFSLHSLDDIAFFLPLESFRSPFTLNGNDEKRHKVSRDPLNGQRLR